MAGKSGKMHIDAYAPRKVCGVLVEPFCEPTSLSTQSQLIGAAVNLIWWAMHESLADGKVEDAKKSGKILIDIIGRELDDASKSEAEKIVDDAIEHYRNLPSGDPSED